LWSHLCHLRHFCNKLSHNRWSTWPRRAPLQHRTIRVGVGRSFRFRLSRRDFLFVLVNHAFQVLDVLRRSRPLIAVPQPLLPWGDKMITVGYPLTLYCSFSLAFCSCCFWLSCFFRGSPIVRRPDCLWRTFLNSFWLSTSLSTSSTTRTSRNRRTQAVRRARLSRTRGCLREIGLSQPAAGTSEQTNAQEPKEPSLLRSSLHLPSLPSINRFQYG